MIKSILTWLLKPILDELEDRIDELEGRIDELENYDPFDQNELDNLNNDIEDHENRLINIEDNYESC